jgi:hypothetical protein
MSTQKRSGSSSPASNLRSSGNGVRNTQTAQTVAVGGKFFNDFSRARYAGLASAMIALVFLFYGAWIFVYGIELNAAIARLWEAKA